MSCSDIEINILIVDDTPASLQSIAAAFRGQGHGISRATSGTEAMRLAGEHEYAAILLDLGDTANGGLQLAAELRQLPLAKATPLLFLIGTAQPEPGLFEAFEAGSVDFLVKPVQEEMLRAKVALFARLYRERLQNRRHEARNLARAKEIGERRYRRLVEGIRDGIVWSANLEMSRFSFVSHYAKRIAGYPLEHWLDDEDFWGRHLHPADRDRVLGALDGIRRTHQSFVLEHRFLKANGETLWLHTGVHVEESLEHGHPELWGLSVDVTHLKETEAALREALRVRDEFIAVASHELRTPITPLQLQVQGFLRLLDTGKLAPLSAESMGKRLRQMLELSEAQVGRLARLVTQLLDVSRIDSGYFDLSPEPTDLGALLGAVLKQLHFEVAAAECRIAIDSHSNVMACVDRQRIEQVITNLLSNAMKYGAGKPIEIRLAALQDEVILQVRDYGIGIEKKDQERIFGRFVRAVSAEHYGGLGLGLYITQQIVSLHRGRIALESEPEAGACFTVTLPIGLEETVRSFHA